MGALDRDAGLVVRRIQPAYRQVADQLRSLILSGELPAGSRLPNETDLSDQFGVSRSTVREALRVLSTHGLLTTTRGVNGGSFVAHPEPEEISRYLETSLGLWSGTDEVSVRELLEVREMLEAPAAGLAAERRTDTELERLHEILQRDRAQQASEAYEGHRLFHEAILELSGNALLPVLAGPLFVTLRTRFLRDQAPVRFWDDVADDHEVIYERIVAGDAAGAREHMSEHLASLALIYERIDRRATETDAPSGTDPRATS